MTWNYPELLRDDQAQACHFWGTDHSQGEAGECHPVALGVVPTWREERQSLTRDVSSSDAKYSISQQLLCNTQQVIKY